MKCAGEDFPPIKLAEVDIMIDHNGKTGKSVLAGMLERRFPITYIPREKYQDADYLISGDAGYTYEKFRRVRIFATGENHDPQLSLYDYCLTHQLKQNDRCLHFPYWLQMLLFDREYLPVLGARPPMTADELAAQKRQFCTFICRNGVCRKRNRFVRHLNERMRVNCPGPFMHNTDFYLGKGRKSKHDYQAGHLFSVAYENEASPGYLTEKILDAFVARSIPIYWGDPQVEEVFNPAAFVHARRFASEKALIDYVIELSQDPERCVQMLNAPVLRNPGVVEEKKREMYDFFEAVFRRGPVIRRTRWQRINGFLCNYYGHGLFRTLRRLSRALRGKKSQ